MHVSAFFNLTIQLNYQFFTNICVIFKVLCDVQESTASTSQPAAQGSSQRPMSRFRLAKQKGKK